MIIGSQLVFAARRYPPGESFPIDTAGAKPGPGAMYRDAKDAGLLWHVPDYALADGPNAVDKSFAFAAAKDAGVDENGNAFYTATLSIGLVPAPHAGVAETATRTHQRLRPIDFDAIAVRLQLSVRDASAPGGTKTTSVPGTYASGVATFRLSGPTVKVAYHDLVYGGASIVVSGSYAIWRQTAVAHEPVILHIHPGGLGGMRPMLDLAARPTLDLAAANPQLRAAPVMTMGPPMQMSSAMQMARQVAFPHPLPNPPPVPPPHPPPHPPPQPPPQLEWTATVYPYDDVTVPLGRTFAGPGYGNRYTVQTDGRTRQIYGEDDLRDIDASQSDFLPYTGLGAIASKYPSFAALYVGMTSRTIVAIPARYGIVRGLARPNAVCRALLDASAGGGGRARFELAFVVGPAIDDTEYMMLRRDVAAKAEIADCTVVLPSQLDPRGGHALTTTFKSTVDFTAGPLPSTFQVQVSIVDADGDLPAVAVANKLIKLIASDASFLMGKLRLHLDDAYSAAVETELVLNFRVTCGTDGELAFAPVDGGVTLTNATALPLRVRHYLVADPHGVGPVQPFDRVLPAGAAAVAPCPTFGEVGTQLAIDSSLEVALPFSAADRARYLAFEVDEVQSVLYQLNVTAIALDFRALGIAKIDAVVTLVELPQLSVPAFSLSPELRSQAQQISLPIMNAIGALNASIALTVHAVDPAVAPVKQELANDFLAAPTVVVTSVPPFASASAPPAA